MLKKLDLQKEEEDAKRMEELEKEYAKEIEFHNTGAIVDVV
jgi:hypothetical protein